MQQPTLEEIQQLGNQEIVTITGLLLNPGITSMFSGKEVRGGVIKPVLGVG
ncbi:MAG: hypothetical protein ACRCU2_02640 [Planktothrix sp.]